MDAISKTERRKQSLSVVLSTYGPGLLVTAAVAMAAQFLSEHYGAPAMLMALLLGIAFHFLAEEGRCVAGIELSAKLVLRIGVALLGMRISVDLLIGLGGGTILLLVSAIVATILFGLVAARLLGRGGVSRFSPAARSPFAAPRPPWPSPPCCPATSFPSAI